MAKQKQVRKRTKPGEIPQILEHKAKGLAYIWLDGRMVYLGKYGSIEAEERRLREWAEFQAKRGHDPNEVDGAPLMVATLVDRFLEDAKTVYQKRGRSTGSYERFIVLVRPLLRFYADTPVSEFGPIALKAVRTAFVDEGLSRKTINTRINLIRQIFKWGVEHELAKSETLNALQAVSGLKKGRTKAPERPPVKAVADWIVDATLEFMPPAVAAMVRIQRLTGMRPGEVCSIRPRDIYREGDEFPEGYEFLSAGLGDIWVYIPDEHKTEQYDKEHYYFLGPKCQQILTSYLDGIGAEDFVFSPAAEARLRSALSRAKRKTKVQPSQQQRRKAEPKRKPGKRYRVDSYRAAVQRSVMRYNRDKAKEAAEKGEAFLQLPKWFPNQLRHTKGTEARAVGGLETAQAVLGHSSMKTSEIYAEKNKGLAIDHARKFS